MKSLKFTIASQRISSFIIVLLSFLLAPSVFAEKLMLGGSGSTTALVKLLADGYNKKNPQDMVTVAPALGRSGGIKALQAKSIDIALMAKPLNESERQLTGAVNTEFARTPTVFAVAASNPKNDITLAEIEALYATPDLNWPDGTRVRLVLRPSTDIDSEVVSGISTAMASALVAAAGRPGALIAATDEDAIMAIQRLPGAFGVTTLGQILADKRPLKALSIDLKVPSAAAIKTGSYPYIKRHFFAAPQNASAIAQRFFAYVFSAEGQNILATHGCWVGEFKGT
jgi:phosphate transport system substrate-binding protein